MSRWLAAVVFAVALAFLGLATPAAAAGDPAAGERDALNRALGIVVTGLSANRSDQARAARDALAVLNADPALAQDKWLREPLEGRSPNLTRAQARFHAALAALAPATTSRADAAVDRQALTDVLADPRFHPRDLMSYLPTWLVPVAVLVAGITDWVGQLIQKALDGALRLLVDFIYSDFFTVIVLVLTAVIVPTVIFLYVRTFRRVLVAQAELANEAGIRILSPAELLESARSAGSRGEFRDACHYAFLAALRVVEDRVDVRLDYSATNREQLRRLTNAAGPLASQYADRLKPLIDRFDQVWYGQAVATDGDFHEIYQLATQLGEVAG